MRLRSCAYAAVSGNSSPKNPPPFTFLRCSSSGQNFPSKFLISRSVFQRYSVCNRIPLHSNSRQRLVAVAFLSAVTRPDSSKTLALYKSCTYLLTYLHIYWHLTFIYNTCTCMRNDCISSNTHQCVYHVPSEKCYRATSISVFWASSK